MNITEIFKEYTSEGFEFVIGHDDYDSSVMIIVASWDGGQFAGECCEVYRGDNLDHALAACELYLEDQQ